MSKSKFRPRSVTVTLTEDEYETIKKISMAFHQSMATHMREVVLFFAPRWTAGEGKKMIDTVDDLYGIYKQVKG